MLIIQLDSEQLSTLIQSAVRTAIIEAPGHAPYPVADELLTVQQAATFLNLAVATIYSMVQRKELPVCKRGGRLYFSKEELTAYVKKGRKKTAAELEGEAAAYVGAKKKRG